ncbi:hypothetical protein FX988_04195 [Paraglaciecola mesophila]|uniref:TonB-dependent receptor n=1 Tax=Paraglaciecola mesophila TaxID=197222 RepID=A0A857JT88_9ALTE|nr:TonB-dependent receptor [Paraglaciecola mesophila]QHJ13914.1 hypothetical protein FX988_04195 [Paraglaciecola mesophila]
MKHFTHSFTHTKLASAVTFALMSLHATSPVYAQQADEQEVEVINVKGVRGALVSAANIKRDSDGVVDAITAQDIGKFPDTNLAESLQRITGVSIDRSNNEGNQVTVRGFGPSFNLVTLNNRQMPTSSTLLEDGIDRSFNFREIAAESVSGVEVYKTGKANISSGGIGSTINIKTAKPFDYDGFKAVATVKGVVDTSVEVGDSVTPEISGMVSQQFADGKVGVLLSLSHAERDSRKERVGTPGWVPERGSNVDKSGIDTSLNPSRTHWAPLAISVDTHDNQRERQNGQLVLQFAPIDTLVATLDYTLSRFEETSNINRTSFWFDGDTGGDADANGTVTNPFRNDDELNFWSYHNYFNTDNDSIGLNLEYQATENLSFNFDYHDSTSHSQPDGRNSETITNLKNPRVNDTNGDGVADRGGVDVSIVTDPNGRPDIFFDAADLPGQDPYARENIQFDLFQTRGYEIENNIKQAQLHGQWVNAYSGALSQINFGLANTDYTIDTYAKRTIAFVPLDISSLDIQFNSSNGFGKDIGGNSNFFPLLSNYSAQDALQLVKDQGFYFQEDPIYNGVNEETLALYVSFDFETEFNQMPIKFTAGLRWEDTDVTSVSLQRGIKALNYVNTAGRFGEVFTDEPTNISLEGSYTRLLPNMDFNIEFTDDLVGRVSYSTTLSRPDLSSLFPSTTIDARPDGPYNASIGNPGLLPLESKNIDLSLEWYYDNGSYASVGFFKKYVENFIGITTREGTMPDVNGNPLTDPSINPRPGCPDEVVGGNPACFSTSDDPQITFLISSPDNLNDAEVDGWELNLQHMFGESGFGTVANMTFVDGNVKYDVYDVESTFALTGLSDSANLIAFYEKDGFQARIAYNWRDDFLLALYQPQRQGEPTFVEAYGQWDINVSYDINENVSVFIEGLNITEETTRRHGRFADQLISAEQFGARYNIGVSAQF